MNYRNYLEIVYPIEKRKIEIYMPWVIIQRIISLPFLGLSIFLKISPNFISLISIFLILIASFLIVLNFLVFGILALTLAVIFDCVDGELARVSKKTSILGERLEFLGADFFTMIGIPSIAIWLFVYNDLSTFILFLCFLSASLSVFARNYFEFDCNFDLKKLNFTEKIIISWSKNQININHTSLLVSIMFFFKDEFDYSRWNFVFSNCFIWIFLSTKYFLFSNFCKYFANSICVSNNICRYLKK